jgi:hypothetical protein
MNPWVTHSNHIQTIARGLSLNDLGQETGSAELQEARLCKVGIVTAALQNSCEELTLEF